MTSGGGAGAVAGPGAALRLQHYLIMAGVAAAVVFACLRYAPAAAGYGFLAVAPPAGAAGRLAHAAAGARRDTPPAAPPSPVVIFNFGDSNSDTGGMAAVNGMNLNLPEGRTFFRRSTGRLSDGRLVIDFICKSTPLLPSCFPATLGIKLLSETAKFFVFVSSLVEKSSPNPST